MSEGWTVASSNIRGKSGLHKGRMPGNARPARVEGQCHRKETTLTFGVPNPREKLKGCGKSAPPCWEHHGQGKPHPEQDQIGITYGAPLRCYPGRSLEVFGNKHIRGMIVTYFGKYKTRLIGPLTFYFSGTGNPLSRMSGAISASRPLKAR